jgi:hypothetical protein
MRKLLAALLRDRLFDVMVLLMMLLVGAFVVAICTYDIYLNQALLGPKEVGTAEIIITGTGHFRGSFGTERYTYVVEGNAPATIEIPFARSDFIMAALEELPGAVQIKVVDKGTAAAMWRVPRNFEAD